MGRQSARIVRKGLDHKGIVGKGFDHVQLWHKGELVWEKLPDGDVYKGLELTFYIKYGADTAYLYAAGDFTVDWGDGSVESYSKPTLTFIYHNYGIVSGFKYVDVIVKGNVTDLDFKSNSYLSAVNSALPPTLEKTDFSTMFAYLNSRDLTINADLFKYCGGVTNFSNCFYNSWLTEIPSGLFDNCVSARTVFGCFSYTHITSIPNGLFANLTALEDIGYCFENCGLLNNMGEDILSNCKQITNAKYFCYNCTKLTYIPYTLFDDCENLNNVIGAFYNGSAITSSLPPLWERDISVWGGTYANVRGCYYGCSNAENYMDAYSVGLFTSKIS